jgi:predicted extracellular nuclease
VQHALSRNQNVNDKISILKATESVKPMLPVRETSKRTTKNDLSNQLSTVDEDLDHNEESAAARKKKQTKPETPAVSTKNRKTTAKPTVTNVPESQVAGRRSQRSKVVGYLVKGLTCFKYL